MCSRRRGGQHTPSSTRPYSHPVLPPIQRALEPTPVLCRRSPLGGWPIPALAHALVRAARCARSRSLAWPWPRSSAPNPPRHTHTRTDLPAHLDHPALAAPRMLARVVPPRSGCAAHACARSACMALQGCTVRLRLRRAARRGRARETQRRAAPGAARKKELGRAGAGRGRPLDNADEQDSFVIQWHAQSLGALLLRREGDGSLCRRRAAGSWHI